MSSLKQMLEKYLSLKPPSVECFSMDRFISKSEEFPIKFPIDSTRCKTLLQHFTSSELAENIFSTYPLIHESVLELIVKFIEYKHVYGSEIEKNMYKEMDILSFIDRLLKLRSVCFVSARDYYKLLSGEEGYGGWEAVGTNNEVPPLTMDRCLTYEEMKISALLYVSGKTVFINDGSRRNKGVDHLSSDSIEKRGVIIGLIGPRMKKENVMEYQDILVTPLQNKHANGYYSTKKPVWSKLEQLFHGDRKDKTILKTMWSNFYEEKMQTYDEVDKEFDKAQNSSSKFTKIRDYYFNDQIYRKRLSITFDCALLEANQRAKTQNKTAYVHVVGIGLGVWKISEHQSKIFVATFLDRVKTLAENLNSVSDVHFAYFDNTIPEDVLPPPGKFITIDNHPKGGIQIHLSRREPSSKLTGEHEGKLLFETYAWDCNAHPGNEYWCGHLDGSGDPAAACSSQIPELHNAHINSDFVSGQNLHIASPKFGVKHISEYSRLCDA